MCDVCGCDHPPADLRSVEIGARLQSLHAGEAVHNRDHFQQAKVFAVNLVSSPGAGKTALLEATIGRGGFAMAVVEGDLATDRDAARIQRLGVPAVQITTGSACHLDARMVHHALEELPLAGVEYLFIENVGNLVCPAGFDLGQHVNVVLLSVAEGDDKPAKYPPIFRGADLVLVTKWDLHPHLPEFDLERVRVSLEDLGVSCPLVTLSSRSGEGMEAWCDWLRRERKMRLEERA